jgi:hypothetical protein
MMPRADYVERFELPYLPTLLEETEDEKVRRTAVVKKTAARFYRAVIRQLGKAEAAALFKRLTPRGKVGKRPNRERNAHLLRTYDDRIWAGEDAKTLPRTMAKESYPEANDARAVSLERQIRRLMRNRDESRQRGSARDLRAFRRIYGFDPPPTTLLSEVGTNAGHSRRTK